MATANHIKLFFALSFLLVSANTCVFSAVPKNDFIAEDVKEETPVTGQKVIASTTTLGAKLFVAWAFIKYALPPIENCSGLGKGKDKAADSLYTNWCKVFSAVWVFDEAKAFLKDLQTFSAEKITQAVKTALENISELSQETEEKISNS